MSEFSFTVPKVVEETIPKDVERKSSARGDKKAKDSKAADS